MSETKVMSETKAELLIATAIIIRSTSYLFASNLIHVLGPFNILALRFGLAFVIMAVVFHKKIMHASRQTIKHSAVLGVLLTLTMGCELTGFRLTDAGITSFLENVSLVLVPLLNGIITKKRPEGDVLACCAICLAGVGFLTLNNGLSGLNVGSVFGIGAAFMYANFIIFTGHFAVDDDPTTLSILQLAFVAVFSAVFSLMFEDFALPTSGMQVVSFVMLAVVCSCFGFTLQSVGQKYVDVSKAGLLCAVSPLVVTIIGVGLLGESLGFDKIVGGVLILAGICTLVYRQGQRTKVND